MKRGGRSRLGSSFAGRAKLLSELMSLMMPHAAPQVSTRILVMLQNSEHHHYRAVAMVLRMLEAIVCERGIPKQQAQGLAAIDEAGPGSA